MDSELLTIFTDRLLEDVPQMREQIASLQTKPADATARLFRTFHNYKASSSYLGLNELHALCCRGENILNALRTSHSSLTEDEMKWLYSATSMLQIWGEQLLSGEALSVPDATLFPMITTLETFEKASDVMQRLNLLYADSNAARTQAFKAPLSHIFNTVETAESLDMLTLALREKPVDIVIVNLQEHAVEAALELLAHRPDMALLTAVPELRAQQKSRLLLKGLTYTIASPITSAELKRQLHALVASHFNDTHTVISHQKIYNFVQGLDPLASSIKKIIRLCDDPESSLKEIIAAVETDAIATATILHAASSPLYGIESTSSVEKAVTSFGKRMIKALTLSDLAYSLGNLNLQAYGVNEEQFKKAAALRLALMNRWYSRVNPHDLSILGTSAILGSLGSILIDQTLCAEGLTAAFKTYADDELSTAEVTLLKTSTAFVSADILEFWALETELVDAIRYSDAPLNAPSRRIRSLACANALVYTMVTPQACLRTSIPKRLESLMKKMGLKPQLLEEALASLH